MEQSFLKNNANVLLSPFVQRDKLNELLNFYLDNNLKICLLDGNTGSFKTNLFNVSKKHLNDDVLVFSFKCFEGSTLDDIFLAFFEDLKKYAQQKKVSFAKIETNSISQRIITYLTNIKTPCVIMIDSLEEIFTKNDEAEREEVLRFISHLYSVEKFKIVLISSSFNELEHSFDKFVNIKMQPYTKTEISEIFPELNPESLEKFYQISGGNQSYVYITSSILVTLKTSLDALILEFEMKNISYEDFILQKLVTFATEKVRKSLYYLSLVNEPLNESFLIGEGFFTNEQLAYAVEKGLLVKEYGGIFIKSYLKKYLIKFIPNYEKNIIHAFWRDFYMSQLPLKPKDRVVLISRNTMRSQIEYHSKFVIAEHKETDSANMSLLSYLNSNILDWNTTVSNSESESRKKKDNGRFLTNSSDSDNSFEKYELTKDEISLLSVPVDLTKKAENINHLNTIKSFNRNDDTEEIQEKQNSIVQIFESAENLETAHDFEMAFIQFHKALTLTNDKDFYEYEPKLLNKMANCARKMNKTVDAIDFYNRLIDLYNSRNDIDNVNAVRLEIAQIYKEIFKINQAKVIYENFVNKAINVSPTVVAKSYIELAGIEEDSANMETAIEYYKKAFELIDDGVQVDDICLSAAYFKYALILDDYNHISEAVDYYQKCINIATDGNIYSSSAYANMGEIVRDTGDIKKAEELFKLGLKIDLKNSNFEGVYYICLKLARLFRESTGNNVSDWLLKSLSAAKKTKENMYIVNAYLELGDYYFDCKEFEKATKFYLYAEKYIQSSRDSQEAGENVYYKMERLKRFVPDNIIEKVKQEVARNGK